jgi:hypothetical protein
VEGRSDDAEREDLRERRFRFDAQETAAFPVGRPDDREVPIRSAVPSWVAGSNGEFSPVVVCMTDAFVIHLRAIPAADRVSPEYESTGWSAGAALIYYVLTPR